MRGAAARRPMQSRCRRRVDAAAASTAAPLPAAATLSLSLLLSESLHRLRVWCGVNECDSNALAGSCCCFAFLPAVAKNTTHLCHRSASRTI